MTSPSARLTQVWIKFCKCESGATAIEYGLIATLISVVAISAYGDAGNAIANNFNTVSDEIDAATKD